MCLFIVDALLQAKFACADHPSDRAANETGDPRAAWMGHPPNTAAADAPAAPKKVKPGATEAHAAHVRPYIFLSERLEDPCRSPAS